MPARETRMGPQLRTPALWIVTAAVLVAPALLVPPTVSAQFGRDQRRIEARGWESAAQNAYERGFREGRLHGEEDSRRGRAFGVEIHATYREADSGYQSRYGNRNAYRDAFRRGFTSGYREGYERFRSQARRQSGRNGRDDRAAGPRAQRGYQEPAYASGFSDGYQHGVEDGRDRDRYDPVRHRDYRDADQGFYGSYGSKDAYRNNYRAGFRPGYEEGYRDGTRRR
jgi:flagellar biosynthesis/type III secretory pathway protein FliH